VQRRKTTLYHQNAQGLTAALLARLHKKAGFLRLGGVCAVKRCELS
jgi:hypothetical protein